MSKPDNDNQDDNPFIWVTRASGSDWHDVSALLTAIYEGRPDLANNLAWIELLDFAHRSLGDCLDMESEWEDM